MFRSAPSSQAAFRQLGFTLVEVMIAVAVLAVGMFGVLSMIPTLSSARTLAVEMVIARQIADTLAERIQGAAWRELGGARTTPGTFNTNSWSLPRYRSSVSPLNPPMTEDDADPNHNLITNGIVVQRTGVPNLKVYVEYYTGLIMNDPVASKRATDRSSWYNAISGSTGIGNRMTTFNGTAADGIAPSTIVRIIVTWREQNGAPINSHEIFTARRE